MKFLNGLQPLALLALRVCLGIIFVYHGYPKLVHANLGMREFFVMHGLPGYLVPVAGILECFGAALLALGLFTRPVALLLAIEMGVAIWKVHSGHGYLVVKEYEFPLAVGAACFALATVGAGAVSMDYLIFGDSGRKKRVAKSGTE
jgi:putative oxidoreductase